MPTIHWVHAAEDALQGLHYLRRANAALSVWTSPAGAGMEWLDAHPMEMRALEAAVRPGDIIVAPRPTDLEVARLAMRRGAHLAAGWHVSDGLHAAVEGAEQSGLAVLAEVGMVPGIDHVMARDLVHDYRSAAQPGDVLHFTSYGGGMPKFPDNFRHKFNVSPLPLLHALATPTSWIEEGARQTSAFPFDQISRYDLNLPVPERHQVYPHYDIAPYLAAYGFDPDWTIGTARRGAIRLKGWDAGWSEIFQRIRECGKDEAMLKELADRLWAEHPFAPGEADRVVLSVALRVENDGETRWHKEWVSESTGGRDGFARFRLNAVMLALGAQALAAGRIGAGLHIGPTQPDLIAEWLIEIADLAGYTRKLNLMRRDEDSITVE